MKEIGMRGGVHILTSPLDLPMRILSKVTRIVWESKLTN